VRSLPAAEELINVPRLAIERARAGGGRRGSRPHGLTLATGTTGRSQRSLKKCVARTSNVEVEGDELGHYRPLRGRRHDRKVSSVAVNVLNLITPLGGQRLEGRTKMAA